MNEVMQSRHPARWWRPIADGRFECELCPRRCKLQDGQRGFCFVRRRVGNALVLTTYGRTSGFCVDPIEKKPLNHYFPGTGTLSFGTAGCNLGCRFCQNWEMSKVRSLDRLAEPASPEAIAEAAVRLGCRSVALTYNDPVPFAEYAIDVADACRARGLATVAVTAGYITEEARPEFFRHMDATNVDLKGFTEGFYRRHCLGRLEPVLDTLRYVQRETPVWLEVTTLLIPGENDGEDELQAAAEWYATELGPDVPWHFTAFHPDFRMLDRPPTPLAALVRAREIALSKGLHHVYIGNRRHREGSTTYCPNCGTAVIERDGYVIRTWALVDGSCGSCGRAIAGHFGLGPGNWSGQRWPVRLESVF